MKRFFVTLIILGASICGARAQAPALNYKQLNARAKKEYSKPVRPGYEGKNPYWNGYSIRFLYAPAFDFKEVEGACTYLYTATVNGKDFSFTAKRPNLSLSPIWKNLPVGDVVLKVEGIDAKRNVVGLAGERKFRRDYPYQGPYHDKTRSYKEAAIKALMFIHHLPCTLSWERNDEPDMSFHNNTYPCKTVSATIRCELMLTNFSEKQGPQALAIAKKAGEFLMRVSQPEGAPLAYFPPTYYGNLQASAKESNKGKTMSMEAAKAAMALLDLYQYTGDKKYLDHTLGIARTYARIQRPDGSIPMKLVVATGEPVNEVNASLHPVLYVFKRLHDQFGIDEFESARIKAENWMNTVAYARFEMVGQFEDVGIEGRKPYENLTHWTGVPYLTYALENGNRTPELVELAKDVINFSEDQFVLWDSDKGKDGFRVNSLPGVWEQHKYRVPVDDSAANMATGWLALYKVTGDKLYYAKAKAMMDNMTVVQDIRSGRIPTVWNERYDREPAKDVWLSCMLIDIQALFQFSAFVGEE